MISIEQILSRCTEEQLESIMDCSLTLMKHFEFITEQTALNLAVQNEHFWKVYTLNSLSFIELAERSQGKRKRIVEPIK